MRWRKYKDLKHKRHLQYVARKSAKRRKHHKNVRERICLTPISLSLKVNGQSMLEREITTSVSTYSFAQVLEYEPFFDEPIDAIDVSIILSNVSRIRLLNLVSVLLNIYSNLAIDKIWLFFESNHHNNRRVIKKRLEYLYRRYGKKDYILSTTKTAIEILRIAFSLEPRIEDCEVDEETIEMDLFKVVLVINQRILSYKLEENKRNLPNLMFISDIINTSMEGNNSQEYKDRLISQIGLAEEFFKFISTDVRFTNLYDAFLKDYGIVRWSEYARTLLALYVLRISEGVTEYIPEDLSIDRHKLINRNVLHSISIPYDKDVAYSSVKDRNGNDDYRIFRGHPIIHVPKKGYLLYSWEFAIDKVYNSLYFDFKDLNTKYNLGINIEQFFTIEFCQEIYFNECMVACIDKSMYESMTEGELKLKYVPKKGELGPPDYLLRNNNCTILFECKDIRMPGSVLESHDYDQIISCFSNKLYMKETSNGKKKNKDRRIGITQLTGHLEEIRNNHFNWDDCDRNSNVYCVLVLSDYKYLYKGFPHIANKWFFKSIDELGVGHEGNKPLIIMSFITLLKYSSLFKEHGLSIILINIPKRTNP